MANIQDEYKSILASSALCLLEGHAKRKQQKYKEEPADARSKRFESERKKFSLLLAELIREAGLPVADTINKLDDPKEGWLRLFSTRRANTLKNRYKAWKPFRDWLEIHRARVFPLSLKDVVDYMQFRMNEPCGKSVPGAFSTSLHLMELVGPFLLEAAWVKSRAERPSVSEVSGQLHVQFGCKLTSKLAKERIKQKQRTNYKFRIPN